ncbi:YraN family protein [Cohaesibacter celericrescens]|uniref:YraN family protein n=1 Tax=Cohaesibacter celericrescens TaxID=2067669 RepID=UPI003567B140
MIGEPASTKNRPNAKASAMAIAKEKQRKRSYDRGIRAERWAGWLMRAKGFQIMKCRYKAQGGEIDLICRKGDLLVFVEVKYRALIDDALYSITPRNQARIVTAASHYLAAYPDETINTYRFDVMAFAKGARFVPLWQHIEAAFDAF